MPGYAPSTVLPQDLKKMDNPAIPGAAAFEGLNQVVVVLANDKKGAEKKLLGATVLGYLSFLSPW